MFFFTGGPSEVLIRVPIKSGGKLPKQALRTIHVSYNGYFASDRLVSVFSGPAKSGGKLPKQALRKIHVSYNGYFASDRLVAIFSGPAKSGGELPKQALRTIHLSYNGYFASDRLVPIFIGSFPLPIGEVAISSAGIPNTQLSNSQSAHTDGGAQVLQPEKLRERKPHRAGRPNRTVRLGIEPWKSSKPAAEKDEEISEKKAGEKPAFFQKIVGEKSRNFSENFRIFF